MVALFKVTFTEWWIKISDVMMGMVSKNARMVYFMDFMDFIRKL